MRRYAMAAMRASHKNSPNRRQFLQTAGAVAAAGVTGTAATPGVSIIVNPTDAVAIADSAQWSLNELERSLEAAGVSVQRCERIADARLANLCIVAAGPSSPEARDILKR